MKRLIKTISFLVVLIPLFLSDPLSADQNKSSTHTLQLLITSDMHGGFTNQVMYPHRKKSGLFHIANYIKQIRLAQKNVILLDTGDIISGSPLSIYYNYLYPTRLAENPFFRLLNSLKYDAIVPGNHDLEHLSLLENFYIPGGKTKWIAANIQQSGIPFFSPYLSIHQPNFKI